MITKELIEKAKKCSTKEELLELAKQENVEVSDDEINAFLASFGTNKELSDEELENVSGGTCYSDCTYAELGIPVEYPQNPSFHPVITTVFNRCMGHPKFNDIFLPECCECDYYYPIGATCYCKIRSKEYDMHKA